MRRMLVFNVQVSDMIEYMLVHRSIFNCLVDRNECLDNPCHGNASCTNTPGTFICVCSSGFTGTGFECEGMYIIVEKIY